MRFYTLITLFGISVALIAIVVVVKYSISPMGNSKNKVDLGRKIFRLQGCSSCHAIGGGISNAPNLAGFITRLKNKISDHNYHQHLNDLKKQRPDLYAHYENIYHNILKTKSENRLRVWFIEHLKNPRFDNFTGLMPAYKHLTDQQIDQLTAFILTLK